MAIAWSPTDVDLWTWWVFAFAIASALTVAVVVKLGIRDAYGKIPGWIPALLALPAFFIIVIALVAGFTVEEFHLGRNQGFAGLLSWSIVLGVVELLVSLCLTDNWKSLD